MEEKSTRVSPHSREANKSAAVVVKATDPPGAGEEDPMPLRNNNNTANDEKKKEEDALDTATDATTESEKPPEDNNTTIKVVVAPSGIIVSSSKKSRPPYKFDPDKITLRFLFANRDGLTVTVECKPSDTVGEVKGALISVWPEDMPNCNSGEDLRLICMGKGYLTPDTRTLEDCQIPVFKTHPTPVNVSVKPTEKSRSGDGGEHVKKKGGAAHQNNSSSVGGGGAAANAATGRAGIASAPSNATETGQGCGCVIL